MPKPPLYLPWKVDADGFITTSAKLDILHEVGQFDKTFANELVRIVNLYYASTTTGKEESHA